MILLLLPLLDNFLLLLVDVSLSRFVDVGVAIIELIMFVVGVGVVAIFPFVSDVGLSTFANGVVGENNSSSCFFADKNGS